MCGIAGVVDGASDTELLLRWRKAASEMGHRGPDMSKYLINSFGNRRCLLGHQRLRIVDLKSQADQPMRYKNLDMVFNGEIYNYQRIRKKLSFRQDDPFQTSSDSEVLIRAYHLDGADCFSEMDGMWAVAFLDRQSKKLEIARDFFGEKPLYYYFDGRVFAFASNLLALRKLCGTKLRVNPEFLETFVRSGYCPPDITIFRNVKRLDAGSRLIFNLETLELQCISSTPLLPDANDFLKTQFSMVQFEDVFSSSLQRRLTADVPLGLMLSGGIDSSYIAAISKQNLGTELDCLTIKYGQGSSIETDRASYVTSILGLKHHIVDVPQEDLLRLLDDSIPSMDEPIGDVAYPLLVKIVGASPMNLKVMLTGDGADELFLSYSGYRRFLKYLNRKHSNLGKLALGLASIRLPMHDQFQRILRKFAPEVLKLTTDQCFLMNLKLESSFWKYKRSETQFSSSPESAVARLYNNAYLNDLAEYLLVKSDRASMWHSKEFRSPFLNRDLLNYILKCDIETLPRGSKDVLSSRLADMLGTDLQFEKRGMFAGGERSFSNVTIPPVTDIKIPVPRNPQEYYRCLILSKWINYRRSELLTPEN